MDSTATVEQTSAPEVPVGPWLWPNVIRRGAVTVLDGDPGVGKSLLTIDLAARVTRGGPWPDGSAGDPAPARVALFCGEDPRDDVVWPRLRAAGANVSLVSIGTPETGALSLTDQADEFDRLIDQIEPDLVVFDPVSLFLSAGGDVRWALAVLVRLASRSGAALLLVRHLTKEWRGRALHRGWGSVGIIGMARTGLLAAPDPQDPTRFVLAATKSNLAATPQSLAYRIGSVDGQAVIEWLGPTATMADEAARGPRKMTGLPGVAMAADWLVRALEAGERPVVEVLQAARAAGISDRTLDRAKAALRVRARLEFRADGRAWLWELPGRDVAG